MSSNKRNKNNRKNNNNFNSNNNGYVVGPNDNQAYKIVTTVDDILQQALLNEGRIAISPSVVLKTAAMSEQLAVIDKSKQQLGDTYVQAVLGPNVVSNFENPYDSFMQWQQHDTYRRDGEVNRAVTLKAQFTLGENIKTNLDVNRSYATEDQNKRALAIISSEPQYQTYKSDIDTINQRVALTDKMLGCLVSAQVFGRGVLQIDYDEDGLPIRLKPLNPMRIGRLFHDKDTWEVRGIEYLDYTAERGQTLIKSENMIYITNKNFHISPNTYQHGYSDLETVVDVSETNRIMNEIDMKEAARRSWAPYILVKFKRRNAKVMKDFINKFREGRTTATAEDVEVEVHEIPLYTDKLVVLRDANEKKIAADVAVPTFLMGREDVTNRATAQSVLQAWEQSVIKQIRNWIKQQLEEQWIKPLLLRLKQVKETVTGEPDEDCLTPESLNPLPPTTEGSGATTAQTKSYALPFANAPPPPPAPLNPQLQVPPQPKPSFPNANPNANPLTVEPNQQVKQMQEQQMQEQQKQLQLQQQQQQQAELEQRDKALKAFSAIEWQRQKRKAERLGVNISDLLTKKQAQTDQAQQQISSQESESANQNPNLKAQSQLGFSYPNSTNTNTNLPPNGKSKKKSFNIFPIDEEGDVEPEESDRAEHEGLPLGYYAEDLEYKVKIEFTPISFDLPSDLGPVVVSLKTAGIIDNIAALEMLHLDKYIEQTRLAEAQKAAEDKLYSDMMFMEQSALANQQAQTPEQQQQQSSQQQPPQLAQAAKERGLQDPRVKAQQARVKMMAQQGMLG